MTDLERRVVYRPEPPIVTDVTPVAPRPSGLAVVRRTMALVFGVIQAVILLRIVLLLLVADRGNGLVSVILSVSGALVEPFRGMFQLDRIVSGGSVLDIAAIVAIVGWTLIEALALALVSLGMRGTPTEA